MENQGVLFQELTRKPYLLLSLQEQYWNLIVEGEKKYEYRRVFRDEPVKAFIYASGSRKAVVGVVDFDAPIVAPVGKIAKIAEEQSPGSTRGMLEYMDGLERAYAIPILSVEILRPISLGVIRHDFPRFNPPQSYYVLANHPKLLKFLQVRRAVRESRNL